MSKTSERLLIHLVPGRARKHNNTRLTLGDFIADVIVDRKADLPVYHYIVQRIGSADVLDWGQEPTFEAAEEHAKNVLAEMVKNDAENGEATG